MQGCKGKVFPIMSHFITKPNFNYRNILIKWFITTFLVQPQNAMTEWLRLRQTLASEHQILPRENSWAPLEVELEWQWVPATQWRNNEEKCFKIRRRAVIVRNMCSDREMLEETQMILAQTCWFIVNVQLQQQATQYCIGTKADFRRERGKQRWKILLSSYQRLKTFKKKKSFLPSKHLLLARVEMKGWRWSTDVL